LLQQPNHPTGLLFVRTKLYNLRVRVRTTKTGSSSTAVQVVRYEYGKTIVVKHFGSAREKGEVLQLKREALDWITRTTHRQSFFPKEPSFDPLFTKYQHLGVKYTFLSEVLSQMFTVFGFDKLENKLLLDLVLIRIVEPSSKLRSRTLLSELFGRDYDLTFIYKSLKSFSLKKGDAEKMLIDFARDKLNFDFSFVLYDVTTLYFESFKQDEEEEGLRKNGFSKDNKPEQPQIIIGLLVNGNGFPLTFSVFPGNKFEGHTLIPALSGLCQKYQIGTLTVVADSAMISEENIKALQNTKLSFIVGARLGYLNQDTVTSISQKLQQTDGAAMRLPWKRVFLICEFSSKRYAKDKSDTEKQITRAQLVLDGKRPTKRLKFLTGEKAAQILNQKLIDRTKLLWGIKGYFTDLALPDMEIIKRYHNLWQVEKSFRMSKSDLLMRPVYHFKKEAIEAHVLICVMALAVAKFMELKSGKSIRVILDALKKVTDARVLNIST
jgi:transposase